jgi:hypothetical protein
MKWPERPERCIVEQFGPEQGRPDAVVDPDVRPPPGVRRLARLEVVLICRGRDRRDVVDARLSDSSHLVIIPHGQSLPFVLMGAPGGWRTDGSQRSGGA